MMYPCDIDCKDDNVYDISVHVHVEKVSIHNGIDENALMHSAND